MIDKGETWFIATIMVILLIGLLAVFALGADIAQLAEFALGADIAQIIWGG